MIVLKQKKKKKILFLVSVVAAAVTFVIVFIFFSVVIYLFSPFFVQTFVNNVIEKQKIINKIKNKRVFVSQYKWNNSYT